METTGLTNSKIGTLAWANRSAGLLSPHERRRYLALVVRSQLGAFPAQLRQMLGLGMRGGSVAIESILIPDSALAREAEARTAELPDFLANHSYRTYFWAAAVAALEGRSYDSELLYVACLLHDTGLEPPPSGKCFTLASADVALLATQYSGWPETRRDQLAEAITLHLNPVVGPEDGLEAYLLATGAAFDVIGRRYGELSADTIARVVDRHPRDNFKRDFRGRFSDSAAATPGSRAQALGRVGFGLAVRMAPFAD